MPIINHGGPRRLPSNQRAVDPARSALHALAAHQQAKYKAAFLVNPVHVVLYNRLRGGIACSCTGSQVTDAGTNPPVGSLLDSQGKASPATLQTLLTGSRFGVSEYGGNRSDFAPGTTKDIVASTNPAMETLLHDLDSDISVLGTDRDNPNLTQDQYGEQTSSNTDLSALDEDLPSDYQPSGDAASDPLSRSLRSTDNRSCPLCFGSGYLGGYSIHNGVRLVLDAQDETMNIERGEIENIEAPFKVSLTSQGYAEFKVTLPAHVVSIDAFRVLRGKRTALVRLFARKEGSQTLTELNSVAAIRSICDGTPWLIRVTPSLDTSGCEFTHLEIQLNLSSSTLACDFPQLGESSDTNLLERLQDVQVNFPSTVVSIHSEDVLADGMVGKLWQVSASQTYQDSLRNVLGWSCNATVLQPYAVQALLPLRLDHRAAGQKSVSPIRITR